MAQYWAQYTLTHFLLVIIPIPASLVNAFYYYLLLLLPYSRIPIPAGLVNAFDYLLLCIYTCPGLGLIHPRLSLPTCQVPLKVATTAPPPPSHPPPRCHGQG